MSDELRAAADFILREQHDGCDHIWNAHQQCQWCHRMRRDVHADELASAYLAEHPDDDDEQITNEFLREVGGQYDGSQVAMRFLIGSREELLIRDNGQWWMFDHSRLGGRFAGTKKLRNRRDVRRLLAALKGE